MALFQGWQRIATVASPRMSQSGRAQGYRTPVNGGLVAWRLFEQHFVAVSSTEGTYVSRAECI